MGMPIMVVQSVKSMTAKKSTSKNTSQIRERVIIYEGSASPRELLEAISIQARAALKGLESTKPPEVETELTEAQKRLAGGKGKAKEDVPQLTGENLELLTFCQRVLATAAAIDRSLRDTKGDAFFKRLQASLPNIDPLSHGEVRMEKGASDEDIIKTYMDWAGKARFEYCDLTVPPASDAAGDEIPSYKHYFNRCVLHPASPLDAHYSWQ